MDEKELLQEIAALKLVIAGLQQQIVDVAIDKLLLDALRLNVTSLQGLVELQTEQINTLKERYERHAHNENYPNRVIDCAY